MNLLSAYKTLKKLEPFFTTHEAAALLEVSPTHAATILARLHHEKIIIRLAQGRFAYSDKIDHLLIPNALSEPMPTYVSLYTALYYHNLIEQIPSTIFAISPGKTKIFHTPLATISIHHIQSNLFTGYELYGKDSVFMATPEKALFDTVYLSPAKSGLFASLTELEIPKKFNKKIFDEWLKKVQNPARKKMIYTKLKSIGI